MADAFRNQIRALLAQGHGTDVIAEALNVDLTVVQAVAGELSDGDRADMIGVLKSIAFDRAAPAGARARAATYLIDEHSGRNDKNAGAMIAVAPIIELTARLAELRARALPARSRREPIEVMSNE